MAYTPIMHFDQEELLVMIHILEESKRESETVKKLLEKFKDEYSFCSSIETKREVEA
jgi:hypothetical protein